MPDKKDEEGTLRGKNTTADADVVDVGVQARVALREI
jgi:hypothetical protein